MSAVEEGSVNCLASIFPASFCTAFKDHLERSLVSFPLVLAMETVPFIASLVEIKWTDFMVGGAELGEWNCTWFLLLGSFWLTAFTMAWVVS